MPQMKTNSMTTLTASDFNLLQIVSGDTSLKRVATKDGGEYAGACPFCRSFDRPNSDRFRVWPHSDKPRFWCRVCGSSGDVFAYIMLKHQVGFKEALKILGGDNVKIERVVVPQPLIEAPGIKSLSEVRISTETVERFYHRGFDQAYAYWKQWNVSEEAARYFRLGFINELVNGVCYHGYTIPHWMTTEHGDALKAVKVRSIDPEAKPKYTCLTTSSPSGIFNDRHLSACDGSRRGPVRTHCLMVEDERTAMFLDQWYPTVAYFPQSAWNHYLSKAFDRVGIVVILADNDGGIGVEKALRVKEYLGGKDSIVLMPEQDKQLSDMSKRLGSDAVHDWLSKKVPGLLPVKTNYGASS